MAWTVWDRWVLKGNATLHEVLQWLEDKGLNAYSISCGSYVLFNSMFPRHKERMDIRKWWIWLGISLKWSCLLTVAILMQWWLVRMKMTMMSIFLSSPSILAISEQLWLLILKRLGYNPVRFHTWTAFIEWVGLKDNVCPITLRRLAAHATIYSLWWERNNRLHNSISTPISVTFKKIDRLVRNSITARKDRKKFHNLMGLWLKHE
ncbi:hypothetical protein Rs2_31062 [Raphanus sativus]|nr:hypothetical protein Rs2_31062 [Raphanus sativus]